MIFPKIISLYRILINTEYIAEFSIRNAECAKIFIHHNCRFLAFFVIDAEDAEIANAGVASFNWIFAKVAH